MKMKIVRKQLNEALEEAAKKQLCIVEAPMGMGKTEAVRSLFENREGFRFWYTLREDEIDGHWIWKRMTELMKKREGRQPLGILDLQFPDTAEERKEFVAVLKKAVKKDTLVAIDDFHECRDEKVNLLIEQIAEAKIEKLHLILIGQEAGELRYGKFVLEDRCTVIRKNLFCLTEEEIGGFFSLNGFPITKEEEKAVFEYTGGWIYIVNLILIDYEKTGCLNDFYSARMYMKELVFDAFSEKEQQILMKLSALENFTLDEAAFVTGEDCRRLLRECAGNTNFMEYDIVNETYKMQKLLRMTAESEFCKHGGSTGAILKKSALWYEINEKPVYAIRSYILAEAYEEVFRILETGDSMELFTISPVIFENFFKKAGKKEKRTHIKLYLHYLLYMAVHGNGGAALLELAELKKEEPETGEGSEKLGELEFVQGILTAGNTEEMLSHIKEAYRLRKGIPSGMIPSDIAIEAVTKIGQNSVRTEPEELKETIIKTKEFVRYFLMLLDREEAGWEWMLEGYYRYMTGSIVKASELAALSFEKACFCGQTAVIIGAAVLKVKCAVCFGDFNAVYEIKKELEEQYKNTDKQGKMQKQYKTAVGYIDEMTGEGQETEEQTDKEESRMPECSYYFVYGNRLVREGKYTHLHALAKRMKQQRQSVLRAYMHAGGSVYLSIAERHLFGAKEAKKEMIRNLRKTQNDNIIAPFMENAKEVLPILHLCSEKDGISDTYLKEVQNHCRMYLTGLKQMTERKKDIGSVSLFLTERETEIMYCVKAGMKNAEIGKKLHIATVTVEKILSGIYRKLGVKGRVEAVKTMEEFL